MPTIHIRKQMKQWLEKSLASKKVSSIETQFWMKDAEKKVHANIDDAICDEIVAIWRSTSYELEFCTFVY